MLHTNVKKKGVKCASKQSPPLKGSWPLSGCTSGVLTVVLNVEVEDDSLAFEGILIDVDVVKLDMLGDDALRLVDADVVED
eukprot:2704997-Amphidinium_carterae.1